MSLKGYVVKKVTALYVRMITCSGETKFQSFNYVIVEKSFTWVASMVEVHNWSSSFYIHFSHDFLIKKPTFKERMVFDCSVDKQSQIPYCFNIVNIVTAPIISLSSSFPDRYMFESNFSFLQVYSHIAVNKDIFFTAPLGSIHELPALSRHAIKLSEGKDTIRKKQVKQRCFTMT